LFNKGVDQNEYKVFDFYYEIITYHIQNEEYDKAYSEISDGLLFIESIGHYSDILNTTYYTTLEYFHAFILTEEGKYQKSLLILDSIIQLLKDFFDEQSITEINSKIKNENSTLLPSLYILKSRTQFLKYKEDNLQSTLVDAFESYKLSVDVLTQTKTAIENEDSKVFATSEILDVYYEAIFIGKTLFEFTGDYRYLEQSFEFTESSKSFALYSEIKDVEAIEFSDLPKDVKEREQTLLGEIQAYEEWLYEEQLSLDPDSTLIEQYRNTLFHLKDDYRYLKLEIEQNYSQYFELKYGAKFISLSEIQEKLPHKDALIEYVLSDTLLITFIVDKKSINVHTQVIEETFVDECFEYYELLHTQNFSDGVHENYRKFVEMGRKFYGILIEPCLRYTDRKNLTIIPDGPIAYLPFEGFLTRKADVEYINYLELPYMIYDFSVGYSHSATLMFSERLKTKSPEDKVLAFAPAYKDPFFNSSEAEIRQALTESEVLLPLNGIIKEVQSINETVPARVFLNENATEANFKKYAPDYNVLHLAMHTIMKDDNPLHSLLAFTNKEIPDTTEDNKLHAYEIYNLKLNAQMAVLSSCSSGYGKMQKGEGMMSLARGFIYAGCPSIIMTLWQVADKSSSDMMTSFYKYLKKGKSKQEAMRLAKIDYLENADDLTSNPYFWSGFVVLGDNSPVYRRSGVVYWVSILVIFVGILLFFNYKRS